MAVVNINIQPTNWILAGNKVQYRVGGSLYLNSGVARPDYKIVCKLFKVEINPGPSLTTTEIGVYDAIPSINNSYVVSGITYYWVDFNFSDPMLAALQNPPMVVTPGRNTPNKFFGFKCEFYEYYDGALVSLTTSNVARAIPAGQPILRNYDFDFLTSYLTAGASQRFLNVFRPKSKILFDEILILNYYNTYTTGFLNLKATAYYRNGEDEETAEFFIYSGANPGENFIYWNVLLSGVSWATSIGDPFYGLSLVNPFDATGIYKIELKVTNPTTTVSETLTFEVIHKRHFWAARAFYFKNSLGFMECLVTTGKNSRTDKLIASEAEVYFDNTDTGTNKIANAPFVNYDLKLSQEYTQALGYSSADFHAQFLDFLRSDLKLQKVGSYYYPIIVTPGDVKGAGDNTKLFGRTFKYKLASEEAYYQ